MDLFDQLEKHENMSERPKEFASRAQWQMEPGTASAEERDISIAEFHKPRYTIHFRGETLTLSRSEAIHLQAQLSARLGE